MGLLLAVVVHSTGIQDKVGAKAVLIRLFACFGTIETVFADSGYTGKLIEWTRAMFCWLLTVVKRTEAHRFVVLPKRWIVERTFGWMNNARRLSKDYETTVKSAEAFVCISCIRLMLRRFEKL